MRRAVRHGGGHERDDRRRTSSAWSSASRRSSASFGSTVRKDDPVGTLIEDWGDELEELSALDVTLQVDGREGATVPVTLESRMTEVGTLELWCVARDRTQRWKLELNIRERDAD